jgi:hypothetical protein
MCLHVAFSDLITKINIIDTNWHTSKKLGMNVMLLEVTPVWDFLWQKYRMVLYEIQNWGQLEIDVMVTKVMFFQHYKI